MLEQIIPALNRKSISSSHSQLRRLLRFSVVRFITWLPLSPLPILLHQHQLHPPPPSLHLPPSPSPLLTFLSVRLVLSWINSGDTVAIQMRSFSPSLAL